MDMLILDHPPHMAYPPPPPPQQEETALPLGTTASYLQDFRSDPCQVCGENASGWHCGSVTCEACKKFFLRSVNEEHLKYKCIREKKCLVSRNTRTQCQYCRYAKCIAVGMKITEESPNPKIEEIFKQIPCAVCQGPSSGIHFGATTCEGCKGFFRRTIKERTPQRYKCAESNNCELNVSTRSACRACRFRKCLLAGMSIEGSRIGRQSNLFKHKMVEMQRRGLIRTQLFNVLATNANGFQQINARSSRINSRKKIATNSAIVIQDSSSYIQPIAIIRLEEKLEPQVIERISIIESAYVNYLKNLPSCDHQTNDLWAACISQLSDYATRVMCFADEIPGFCTLTADDQLQLIRSSVHSIILICLCSQAIRFRLTPGRQSAAAAISDWNYLNVPSESTFGQHLQQTFPIFFEVHRATSSIEKELEILALDDKELALMLTLLITSIANTKLKESKKIETLEDDLFCALFDYMDAKRGTDNKDYFILTIQIPLIHRINSMISTHVLNLNCPLPYRIPSVYLQDDLMLTDHNNSHLDSEQIFYCSDQH